MSTLPRLLRFARSLRDSRSGLALTEFALSAPLVMAIGGYGIEYANLSLTNMRVSQIALNLADNASRVGLTSTNTTTQLRETDINDVFIGARLQGANLGITTNGRIILSSLENVQQSYDSTSVQRIHWQRCAGLMSGAAYNSHYGTTTTQAGQTAKPADAGSNASSGMGETGSEVIAPQGGGVMFVEINYRYQPLFGSMFVSSRVIRYTASFVVRDKREFSQIFNPNPSATPSTCDLYRA